MADGGKVGEHPKDLIGGLKMTERRQLLVNNRISSQFVVYPDPSDHELRGSVGRSGVCPGEGAVSRPQPCHPVGLHRRHRGEAARWLPAVFSLPRPLRQDGRPPVARESGRDIERKMKGMRQPFDVLTLSCRPGGHGDQRRTSGSAYEARGKRGSILCARD